MKIKLKIEEILNTLQAVIGVVEKKQTLPILSHVLINLNNKILTLTTTDMELEISASKTISNDNENIKFTVYAKDLIDIVKKLPEKTEIELQIEDEYIYIKTNNNTFKLNTFKSKDFPLLPKTQNNKSILIDQNKLINLIEKTSFSMGNQHIRNYLNGLYLEIDKKNITFVSTDGHRLSIGSLEQKNDINEKISVIIPRKAIIEIIKILDKNENKKITIEISENYFLLKNNNKKLITRLIDGKFPDYKNVIPQEFNESIIINKDDFLSNLQQASIFVEERKKCVKLIFKEEKLNIFSNSERGQAKTQINIKNQKIETKIAFNIHYLISILEKIETKEILMFLPSDNKQSCVITASENKNYQYIVMPMSL